MMMRALIVSAIAIAVALADDETTQRTTTCSDYFFLDCHNVEGCRPHLDIFEGEVCVDDFGDNDSDGGKRFFHTHLNLPSLENINIHTSWSIYTSSYIYTRIYTHSQTRTHTHTHAHTRTHT